MLYSKMFFRISILALAVAMSGCAQDVPPVNCEAPNFQCYIDQALKGVTVVRQNIAYWSNVHFIVQVFIVVFGIVATIMIALQGDQNRYWTRPIGLVATTLVTGLTSALVSFHVPDNIDKLIDVVGRMVIITNEFDYQANKLKAGRSQNEIEEAFKRDSNFRDKAMDLTRKFSTEYNQAKLEMLKLSGSAARLTAISAPSTPEPAPKKSGVDQ